MGIQIINGVNTITADLEGKTIAELRTMLAQALNIDPESVAMVNGDQVSEDHRITDGDEVEFVKSSGKKGAGNSVINGVNELSADLAGKSICEVRTMLAQALNIDPEAVATVDGETVGEGYTLEDGDTIEFVKASGKKGC